MHNYNKYVFCLAVFLVILVCVGAEGKSTDNATSQNTVEHKVPNKIGGAGMALVFVEELKIMMERHVLGICPQSYKMQGKAKNSTSTTCDVEIDGHELAGRLASLALRAHSAGRSSDCSRLGLALANAFSELARTQAHRQNYGNNAADAGKKRKLSKSQKAKIQAKQRTALAVKKKAAAIAARQQTSTTLA